MEYSKEDTKIVNPVVNWGMYLVMDDKDDLEPLHMTLLCQGIQSPTSENPGYSVTFRIYKIHEETPGEESERLDYKELSKIHFPIRSLDMTGKEYGNYLEKALHGTIVSCLLEPFDTFQKLQKWASEPYKPDL